MPNEPASDARHRGFATTRWSLVLAAGAPGATGGDDALAELCAEYWSPLYAYARRRGYDVEDARDLTQAFFAKLLEKRDLAAADPARGRFRTFLLTAMKNFLAGEWRRHRALKRSGAVAVLSMDFESAESAYTREPSHDLTPEALYERRWALRVLERAASDLRRQYREAGQLELFDALKGVLGGDEEVLPYAELASRLGQSEGALRTAASRLRSRWRTRLRALVAQTVGDPADVQDELRRLAASMDTRV